MLLETEYNQQNTHTEEIYNRETIAASNLEIHQMSFTPPFPFYATQIINPFHNSRILANHDKVDGLSANGEILIKEIVSLS